MNGGFILLHLIAVLFYLPALFITIPLHLVAAALSPKADTDRPTPRTHVKCPDCAELVRKEAKVCKHCGCKLVPQP